MNLDYNPLKDNFWYKFLVWAPLSVSWLDELSQAKPQIEALALIDEAKFRQNITRGPWEIKLGISQRIIGQELRMEWRESLHLDWI